MKTLIIILCLLATAIIGYQIASALTISSGSMSISSGALSVHTYNDSSNILLIDGSGTTNRLYIDGSANSLEIDGVD